MWEVILLIGACAPWPGLMILIVRAVDKDHPSK